MCMCPQVHGHTRCEQIFKGSWGYIQASPEKPQCRVCRARGSEAGLGTGGSPLDSGRVGRTSGNMQDLPRSKQRPTVGRIFHLG